MTMNTHGALVDAIDEAGLKAHYTGSRGVFRADSKYFGSDDLFFGVLDSDEDNGFFIGCYSDSSWTMRFLVAAFEDLDACAKACVEAVKAELGVS